MNTEYEIAVDIDINGGEDSYIELGVTIDVGGFNGGTYGFVGETASFYITRAANTLNEAFDDVSNMLTDNECVGKIIGFRDMRIDTITLSNVEAGYLPDGYKHVSTANPNATGHYWCLCKVGLDKPTLEFRRIFFRSEHNSRWLEDTEARVLAWTM